MEKIHRSSLMLLLSILLCSGCQGLNVEYKGQFYRSDRAGADFRKLRRVGIYVFSNGASRTAYDRSAKNLFLHFNLFPPEIKHGKRFQTDAMNVVATASLAEAIQHELLQRGYLAEVIENPSPGDSLTVDDCLKHAANHGYSSAFVAVYTGITEWSEPDHTSDKFFLGRSRITEEGTRIYSGYLYLTNASFFEVSTGNRVWSSTHYGIVEQAHLISFGEASFITIVPEALVHNGGADFEEASITAAHVLFNPEYWKQSFQELPTISSE